MCTRICIVKSLDKILNILSNDDVLLCVYIFYILYFLYCIILFFFLVCIVMHQSERIIMLVEMNINNFYFLQRLTIFLVIYRRMFHWTSNHKLLYPLIIPHIPPRGSSHRNMDYIIIHYTMSSLLSLPTRRKKTKIIFVII